MSKTLGAHVALIPKPDQITILMAVGRKRGKTLHVGMLSFIPIDEMLGAVREYFIDDYSQRHMTQGLAQMQMQQYQAHMQMMQAKAQQNTLAAGLYSSRTVGQGLSNLQGQGSTLGGPNWGGLGTAYQQYNPQHIPLPQQTPLPPHFRDECLLAYTALTSVLAVIKMKDMERDTIDEEMPEPVAA